MPVGKEEKKKIWIYAVVLFSSAFIVLLLTAYSQIKLNKNINDYRSQLYNKQKENTDFEFNLNSSLQTNKQLKKEITTLKKEISKLKGSKEEINKNIDELEAKTRSTASAYEVLFSADDANNSGDIVQCALLLTTKCDSTMLGAKAVEKYNKLIDETRVKAARELYLTGYNEYKSESFTEAIRNFELSLQLTAQEYFSDDCMYFIAYSQKNLGQLNLSRDISKRLLENYPDSNYKEDVNDLLKMVNG